MKVYTARLAGLFLIEPVIAADERGAFFEAYQQDRYAAMGIAVDFVQDNHSRSRGGTIRGLHYQVAPGQAKLVRVARGAIVDVVVDIRPRSSTFGEWEAFELDDRLNRQLYVPIGFAHGFCVTSDVADVVYKVSSNYSPDTERGIAWNDPAVNIRWPVDEPILSGRDRSNPTLSEVSDELPRWDPG
jgi:dTDP-4-dehydrorhamnose 3,5-epimerase